ncbi:hypothetical protein EG328_006175 [Venturia inaequalis]|uniref:Uncharacterized protein n=1 Tax=Venturia inaequalis TaxID=5025 RepID=A0A8H3UHB5_VENIN|nr:hypothetical protein EG328_006175 [Venturia inaequalis]RDI84654.1 hypothetical protein Vi05172_g5196 [Venturia inaequalis]
MFDIYLRLMGHGVRKSLADRIDRLITVLLDHIEFFECNESHRTAPLAAKVMSDQIEMIYDTLLKTECQKIMHKNEKNYLLYLEIRQIIPMAETILECNERGDGKGAREAATKCREWIEGLQ